jgi:hypothetical protein
MEEGSFVLIVFYYSILLCSYTVRPNKKEQQQPRELRVQNCHRNPDGTDIYDDSSNMMEVSPVDKEESDVGALSVPS